MFLEEVSNSGRQTATAGGFAASGGANAQRGPARAASAVSGAPRPVAGATAGGGRRCPQPVRRGQRRPARGPAGPASSRSGAGRLALGLAAAGSIAALAAHAEPAGADRSDPGSLDHARLLEPIRDAHRRQENTGYAFKMSHRGRLVLADVAGVAVLEHDVPVTFDSRFPVMSVTKAFTGLSLAVAVAGGLLDLDEPIAVYLPDYEGEGADSMSLRQLATHTAGVPHTGHPQRRDLYVRHFTDASSSRYVYESEPLVFSPGSSYGYSSAGYNLIAAIIERRSGENYKDYVRRHVIRVLGLEDTDFDEAELPIEGRVRNYSYVDLWAQPWRSSDRLLQVPTWDFSYNLGGGNMYSTVDDLLELGNALIDRRAFPREVWATALQRTGETAALSRWSLGWIHGADGDDRSTIYITGATPGVQAALYVYPDHDIVFAALANCWCKNSAGAELVIGAPQAVVARYLESGGGAAVR